MSVVHNNLSRGEGRTPGGDEGVSRPDPPPDPGDFEREVQRKEKMLKQGLRQMEEQIARLTAELDAVRRELQKEREDNLRLRQGAMSDRLGPRPTTRSADPSLLSRALE